MCILVFVEEFVEDKVEIVLDVLGQNDYKVLEKD